MTRTIPTRLGAMAVLIVGASSSGCAGCAAPDGPLASPPAAPAVPAAPVEGWAERLARDPDAVVAFAEAHDGLVRLALDDDSIAFDDTVWQPANASDVIGRARAALASAESWTTLGEAMHAVSRVSSAPASRACQSAPDDIACRLDHTLLAGGAAPEAAQREARAHCDGDVGAATARLVACALVGDVARGQLALAMVDAAGEQGGASAVLARGRLAAHLAARLACGDDTSPVLAALCARALARLGADDMADEAAAIAAHAAEVPLAFTLFAHGARSGALADWHAGWLDPMQARLPGPALAGCLDRGHPCPLEAEPMMIFEALIERHRRQDAWIDGLDDDVRALIVAYRASDGALCQDALDAAEAYQRQGAPVAARTLLAMLPARACAITRDGASRPTTRHATLSIAVAISLGDPQAAYAIAAARAEEAGAVSAWADAADLIQLWGLDRRPVEHPTVPE